MIDDESVPDIHSTINDEIQNAAGDSFILGDLSKEKIKVETARLKRKRTIRLDDPDYIAISKKVEKFNKK